MAVGTYCEPYARPKSDTAPLASCPWKIMMPCHGAKVHATPLFARPVSAT